MTPGRDDRHLKRYLAPPLDSGIMTAAAPVSPILVAPAAIAEIDRAAAFQDHWGGLALPPAPFCGGGPRILDADGPEGSAAEGRLSAAGRCRVSMAYGFMIGPDGASGSMPIAGLRCMPAQTDGWVLGAGRACRSPGQDRDKDQGEGVEPWDLVFTHQVLEPCHDLASCYLQSGRLGLETLELKLAMVCASATHHKERTRIASGREDSGANPLVGGLRSAARPANGARVSRRWCRRVR